MTDAITRYALQDELKTDDIEQILNDDEISVTVKRQGDFGDGFSSEISDYEPVGTIQARIDNENSENSNKYKKEKSANGDIETVENIFIGITMDSSLGVMIGDVWTYDGNDYRIVEFIGIHQSKIEVVLKVFNVSFPAS